MVCELYTSFLMHVYTDLTRPAWNIFWFSITKGKLKAPKTTHTCTNVSSFRACSSYKVNQQGQEQKTPKILRKRKRKKGQEQSKELREWE